MAKSPYALQIFVVGAHKTGKSTVGGWLREHLEIREAEVEFVDDTTADPVKDEGTLRQILRGKRVLLKVITIDKNTKETIVG